jgi:hypothetical protein
MTFVKHAGSQLKRFLGITHDQAKYNSEYMYAELPGKIVYRSDPLDSTQLMVLRSSEPIALGRRTMVVVNPDLGKFASYNCETIFEPGEIPTVYIHNYDGFYDDMELDWLFRFYFIK